MTREELDKNVIETLNDQSADLKKKADEDSLNVLRELGKLTPAEVRFFRQNKGVTVEVSKLIKNFQSMLRKGDFHNLPEWKENFERVFKKYWRNHSHTLMVPKN